MFYKQLNAHIYFLTLNNYIHYVIIGKGSQKKISKVEWYLVQFQEPSFVFDCEQIYNRFLGKYDNVPESDDTTNDQHASKKQRVVSFLYDIKLPAVIEEKICV